jgi:amidase
MGRLPQLSLPIANVGGVPVGLSLLARHGQDDFLLGVAKIIEKQFGG